MIHDFFFHLILVKSQKSEYSGSRLVEILLKNKPFWRAIVTCQSVHWLSIGDVFYTLCSVYPNKDEKEETGRNVFFKNNVISQVFNKTLFKKNNINNSYFYYANLKQNEKVI